ncbi:MAG: hypothetical protein NXI09_07010 [Bacteroidetes bacterium]|nr:hypothetical protein [Bacteroidota bacterium]
MISAKTNKKSRQIYYASKSDLNLIILTKVGVAILILTLTYFVFKDIEKNRFYSFNSYIGIIILPIFSFGLIIHSLTSYKTKIISIKDGHFLRSTYSRIKGIKEFSVRLDHLTYSAREPFSNNPLFRKIIIDFFDRGEKITSVSNSLLGPKKKHVRTLHEILKEEKITIANKK